MDYGERYADKKISAVNRELRHTYRTAQAELKKKLADFEKRFAEENRRKKQQLADGEISKQDYQNWLTGRVFVRNQWQSNLRQVCMVMQDCNKQAMNIVKTSRFDVFAENYNYNAWKAEREIAVSFNLYSAEAVARLMLGDPQLLPEWNIDEEKDYKWNYKKVNNIVRQGIIQGEGVPEITERLCRDLATGNEAKMRMFARTAINSAQNAGRQKQMEDAANMGIEVSKRWMATHDSRTRDAHRDLDGDEVPYDKPFKSQLGEIMFPGDPTAEPANVYNCRCRTVTIYPKYEDRSKKYGEGVTIDGQSYEEWKKGKKKRGEVVSLNESQFDNPQKAFYSKNATSNRQIVEQLEKDGFIESGNGSTLEGIDVKCSQMIYDCYKRTFERFPFLESWDFKGIKTSALDPRTYADCDSDTGLIRIGMGYFSSYDFLKTSYADDVKNGYHPRGTTEEAIIFHEIGHRFNGILQTEAGTTDRFSKYMLEKCLNKAKARPWRTFEEDEVFSQISIYAGKNDEEWFAECFATYMTAKEDDMSDMQKAWNILFEDAVRRYF